MDQENAKGTFFGVHCTCGYSTFFGVHCTCEMATMNPFSVLDDDAEDPSQLIAAELERIVVSTPKKAGVQDRGKLGDHSLSQQKRKVARMPTKPQLLREARNVTYEGGRVGVLGYAGFVKREFSCDENSFCLPKPAARYRGGHRSAVAAACSSAVQKEEMTLAEYEKVLEAKRKVLQPLKTEGRKVDTQEFLSMRKLSREKGYDDYALKFHQTAKNSTTDQRTENSKFAEAAPESSSDQKRRKGKRKVGDDSDGSSDDSDGASELYFTVLVTDSMVRLRELSLPAATCRKYMWRRIPPRPQWEAVSAGEPRMRTWYFSSSEENFDRKIIVHFDGWGTFVESNNLKEKDIVTFKKAFKDQVVFYAHIHRWANRIHDYERLRFCPLCNEDI